MTGWVGFGTGPRFYRAANLTSLEDIALAEQKNEVDGIALSVDPLVFGDFPKSVKVSRNLSFTEEEKQLIRGTFLIPSNPSTFVCYQILTTLNKVGVRQTA